MSKVPTYWVMWDEPSAKLAKDFVGGYGPGEREAAKESARAFAREVMARPGASGVRIELHEPNEHTDRPATSSVAIED